MVDLFRFEGEVAGVEGGLLFGGGAVVELDLSGWCWKDVALGDGGEGGDAEAFDGFERAAAEDERDVSSGSTVVVDGDGDEPADVVTLASGELARFDRDDAEVGKAAVVEDPVAEEPCEVFAGGFFEEVLEADGLCVRAGVQEGLRAPGGERAGEGVFSDESSEHPEDGCGLAAEVEFGGGGDEGLARRG